MQKTKRKYNREEALFRMAAICSKSEQCSGDIIAKLQRLEINDSDDIKYIIDYLQREKYIDNNRYANAYARDKARFEGWGRIKIAYNLKLKGISKTSIDDAISTIDEENYNEQLLSIIKSKARLLKGKDFYQQKVAIYRFATQRGFESQLIMNAISKVIGDECD